MTKKEILAMKPGIDLNILVAERILGHAVKQDEIMGYMERITMPKTQNGTSCASCATCGGSAVEGDSIWGLVEKYSEDISAAKVVIKKMLEIGYKDANSWADFGDGKYTEAEAICKAALVAVL
jgi:hypothetical protein